jgi:serine/threonine protein kinase
VSEGLPAEEFGPYLVYEQLGMGGMAQVHRAVMKGADPRHPVALKRILPHIASNEEMVKSFVREARLASYLRHPNVAQTYDCGKVGNVDFIAMELITGRNLRKVLKHCARTTGPMPAQIALNILNQICDALDYAHNLRDDTGQPLGIIHRDVSPSNIIVSETGVVKLIDFGVAKASAAGMQTRSGALKGKFAYMAPEYLVGQLDARADLFAIGVIAHELLTNRPLFAGRDDIDTMRRMRSMRIVPPSQKNPLVPPEIDDIVMTALARDPDRRWQHATALRTALTTLTRRLDLVATNPQVVQWLDWAFTHAADAPRPGAPPKPEPDPDPKTEIDARTEIDGQPISDEPSISIEGGTAQRMVTDQELAPVMPGGAPSPLIHAPAGTPPLPSAVVPPSERPASTVLGTAAPEVRAILASAAAFARAGRTSSPPAIHPNATPMSAALVAHLTAAQPLAAPGVHANAAPIPPPSGNPAPAGWTPGFATPASAAPMFPAAQGPQPEIAQLMSIPSIVAMPRRSSRLVTVVLVILAAAIAVIAVYFVLPFLL